MPKPAFFTLKACLAGLSVPMQYILPKCQENNVRLIPLIFHVVFEKNLYGFYREAPLYSTLYIACFPHITKINVHTFQVAIFNTAVVCAMQSVRTRVKVRGRSAVVMIRFSAVPNHPDVNYLCKLNNDRYKLCKYIHEQYRTSLIILLLLQTRNLLISRPVPSPLGYVASHTHTHTHTHTPYL